MIALHFGKVIPAAMRKPNGGNKSRCGSLGGKKNPSSLNLESNSLSIMLFRVGLKHRVLSRVDSGKNNQKASQFGHQ